MAHRSGHRGFGWHVVGGIAIAAILSLSSLPLVNAQHSTPSASPSSLAPRTLPPAWLQFGPDGHLMVRIIVDGQCPALELDGIAVAMSQRAAPSAAFPVVACEATVPFGAQSATIGDQVLPLPSGPFQKIAVIGDTGCRLSDWDKEYQACNDPQSWPFARIARSVAAWDPDLIVHVGDYLYREAPCPASEAGCRGSPNGDNWATWSADFFTPASSLLGVAPWVFMRGNHETCNRNAGGWFTYLDPQRYEATCQRFTEPYVAPLHGVVLAIIDSAEAADETVTSEEQAEYARQFDLLAEMVPPGAWLVTHRPVWGILAGKAGEYEVENASYEAATGGALKADYGLVLSGHIHLAETIAFDEPSARPPQLISGNAGTALDEIPTASPTAGQLGDPAVTEAETLSAFGFLTLEPQGSDWIATQRDAKGDPLRRCQLDLQAVTCTTADSTR